MLPWCSPANHHGLSSRRPGFKSRREHHLSLPVLKYNKILLNPFSIPTFVKKFSNPRIDSSCYIAPSAVVIGDVIIEKDCSIWPNAVIRGDENVIRIGEKSNIQDCCVIHSDREHAVIIGKFVTLGHGAIVHGANIEDECIIGMHATILNGAKIRKGSIIGANALVTENMEVPENSLVVGIPGKVIKNSKEFREIAKRNAEEYLEIAKYYKEKV